MTTDLDDVRWRELQHNDAELELRARPPLRRPRAVDAGIIVIAVSASPGPPCGTWR